MRLSDLETPCLVLDRGKLDKNLQGMAHRLAQCGAALRPHAKTAKCIDVVRRALEGQPGGITVSTLKEAEYFFGHGIGDILYAVGIAPNKLERAARLLRDGADLTLVLDCAEQARMIAARGRELGVTFSALIEIDSDGHRSGVAPEAPALIEIGHILHEERGAALKGVVTHAGESYECRSVDAIREMAAQERCAATRCAERLVAAGLPCPVVSVGSTPTAHFGEDFSGVTEVRAGVYMFNDLVMTELGVCALSDVAISVLATVIGHQREKGWIIADAGWTALSRDRGTTGHSVGHGFGIVCDLDGNPLPGLTVRTTTQEHGIVASSAGALRLEEFPVGRQLRILPNHACATGSMHDRCVVVDGTTEVIDVWQRINGW